ncbi:adenine deaminase C-terminal domain-containing protein, partial [Tianweitania sp.]|uniref:adenine deaminase C-terminal domain-containing protein n=1 Tax=Tianweitania sp. TaxID=2021634 RepID=UPI00289891C1
GADLQGFAAAGIASDHEITSGDDVLEKLRAGFTVELRGSHDYVLPGVVAALKTLPQVPQTLSLCTDDIFPDDLVKVGGMIDHIHRLVGHGMPAIDALRAGTLNGAMRLGREDLGRVAAGRRADIVVLADLESFAVQRVFVSGKQAARNGQLLAGTPGEPTTAFTDTVKLAPLTAEDFTLYAPAETGDTVEINTVYRPRFTEWQRLTVPVVNGVLDLPEDKLVMAVVHRHAKRSAQPSLGVLDEWGSWTGAIATTIAHDSHNLNVFGRDPADMAAAANALIACGGGMAVAKDGKVIALLPLPVCGLLSDAPVAKTAEALTKLRDAAAEVADWLPPVRTFKALVGASLACNPGPRVTDMGIGDGATGELRSLFDLHQF